MAPRLADRLHDGPRRAPGDYFEYRVGPLSVLIVRGDDGELRAFQNVCRHRGNALCTGGGEGLSEIRCGYHRWCWDLAGRLREVPSRRGFGALRNDELPLFPVQVGEWAPLVFVNLDLSAPPLDEFLEGIPADAPWLGLADFRCTYDVEMPLACNWKTLIDGFSETYHVQGLHREMLPMTDDVNSPQRLWDLHGKLEQPYGVQSPRIRDEKSSQEIYDAFVAVMGTRIGKPVAEPAGPVPEIPNGSTLRDVLADGVRATAAGIGVDLEGLSTEQLLNMQQYNLFPNATIVAFPDLLQVVKARPGETPDECLMDTLVFERRPRGAPHVPPMPRAGEPRRDRLRHGDQPGRRGAREGAARDPPARLHAPHALRRGVPDREPAPQPRALPRHQPQRDHAVTSRRP